MIFLFYSLFLTFLLGLLYTKVIRLFKVFYKCFTVLLQYIKYCFSTFWKHNFKSHFKCHELTMCMLVFIS